VDEEARPGLQQITESSQNDPDSPQSPGQSFFLSNSHFGGKTFVSLSRTKIQEVADGHAKGIDS
jgi:hypothetical protein